MDEVARNEIVPASSEKTIPIPQELPLVSLCIAMHNEEAHIANCLDSILKQTYPQEKIEVIVADGLSTDRSADIVRHYATQYPNISLVTNPRRITPVAFNLGIAQAKGDLISIVSSHATLHTEYVARCVHYAQETGASHVGGVVNAIGTTTVSKAISLATSSPFGVGGAKFRYTDKPGYVDTIFMGVYRRDVFDQIGLFDEELVRNQDDEFNYRLNAAGGNHYLHPSIISTYYNRATLKSLWKQYFQYGEWKVRVAQKVPNQIRPRHLIPFGFCLFLFSGLLIPAFGSVFEGVWGRGLSLYLIINLIFSLNIAKANGWHYLPWLPLVFSCLHLAYGLGFAKGLVRFGRYWLPS